MQVKARNTEKVFNQEERRSVAQAQLMQCCMSEVIDGIMIIGRSLEMMDGPMMRYYHILKKLNIMRCMTMNIMVKEAH